MNENANDVVGRGLAPAAPKESNIVFAREGRPLPYENAFIFFLNTKKDGISVLLGNYLSVPFATPLRISLSKSNIEERI